MQGSRGDLYWIGTKPAHRKRGYASAMFHHLLQSAVTLGYKTSGLLASPEGLGLYQKFGFQAIADFYEYSLRKNV